MCKPPIVVIRESGLTIIELELELNVNDIKVNPRFIASPTVQVRRHTCAVQARHG